MAQKTGALIFDETADRYDIRFTLTTTTEDCIVGIALKCLCAANGSRPAWSTGTTGILLV